MKRIKRMENWLYDGVDKSEHLWRGLDRWFGKVAGVIAACICLPFITVVAVYGHFVTYLLERIKK